MAKNTIIAKLVNKSHRVWWWLTRPNTQGVKVFLVSKNKILLVRLTYYPNNWTYPGGGIGKNEKPEEAACRECAEEVGISLSDLQHLGTLSFDHEHKKDTVHIFLSVLEKEISPTADEKEVAEARWFSFDDLPQMGRNAKKMLSLYHGSFVV